MSCNHKWKEVVVIKDKYVYCEYCEMDYREYSKQYCYKREKFRGLDDEEDCDENSLTYWRDYCAREDD